jgi:hypothetical protein
MNYELAKQLKDEGFEQEREDINSKHYLVGTDKWMTLETANKIKSGVSVMNFDKCLVYIPTLSELIDACGDGFGSLNKDNNFIGGFIAFGGIIGETLECRGKNPKEAVAKLWLELNEKHSN